MSSPESPSAEWYYVGYYGQLGPLTTAQMEELVRDGVIDRETYVWKSGMAQWDVAETVPPFMHSFRVTQPQGPPPVPIGRIGQSAPSEPTLPHLPLTSNSPAQAIPGYSRLANDSLLPRSDKNRVVAGILQILLPGVGRMYLGYAAIGVLQFLLWPCFAGWLWSLIDGIMILSGNMNLDGYGRRLPE